jgi:hypothetical protein
VTETGLPISLSTNGVSIAIAGSWTAVVAGRDEMVGTGGEDVNRSVTRSAPLHPTNRQLSATAAALMRSRSPDAFGRERRVHVAEAQVRDDGIEVVMRDEL